MEKDINNTNLKNPTFISRLGDSVKKLFKAQGMPKYQHLYLSSLSGQPRGKLQIKHGGGVGTVMNCFYEPKIASYVYWLELNGEMACVPELFLEEIN